ncbi:hypothetical protein I6N98_08520 [Spongiibacter nanhainus]|uniref:Uncharacterized protein n=1 Tax=Spongiibacter nanhainus TaxID=2794344 RepID=A0A7T4R3N9_9GAMM|nr:hypothetical protein [Spongiibacter nanhainus]QQD19861.1 hypothetical protein I6N98_08520 [Spongiibacter nanhainus]
MSREGLSTSALARHLALPLPQLFTLLKDYGWIRKVEGGWELTAKGEFEGGRYINSRRYGRYIVWPEEIGSHPLLQSLESNRLLSVSELSQRLHVKGAMINRILVALGWMRPGVLGWRLTQEGQAQGGQVFENQTSQLSYALWPEDVLQDSALLWFCRQLLEAEQSTSEPGQEGEDLFSGATGQVVSLDGSLCPSPAHRVIAQWLYLAGIRYAMQQPLPGMAELQSDFYLPEFRLYLDYWGDADKPDILNKRMQRSEYYRENDASAVEVYPEDLADLDDTLGRRLIELNVTFY